jgi:hypothetical protein
MMQTPRLLLAAGLVAVLGACDDSSGPNIPNAPVSVAVAALTPSSVQVSWTAADNDVDGYEIARGEGINAPTFTVLDTVQTSPFTDTGLNPETAYSYRLVALRSSGRSPEVQASGRTGQRGSVTIGANITSNRTLFRDSVYRLTSFVQVTNGATLSIQDGTRIEGDAGSALFITRGAKIEARGTAARPIVFTSSRTSQRRAGDWGGLVIIGNGVINRTGGIQIEGTGTGDNNPAQFYGGSPTPNNADNSGVLQYVRIEFAGFGPATNQELNSLTLAAVGSGTTVDHVQTMYGLDDSFEWFGGAVDAKYLVSYESGDDHFDASEGYVGRNQYMIAFQSTVPTVSPGSGQVSGDPQGFEVDGCQDSSGGTCGVAGNNAEPFTTPVFANFTVVGAPAGVLPAGGGVGAVIRRGGGGFYVNGVVARWSSSAFALEGSAVKSRMDAGQLVVNNVLLAENGNSFLPTSTSGSSTTTRYSLDPAQNAIQLFAGTTASLFTAFPAAAGTSTTGASFDWSPAASSPIAQGGMTAFTGALQARAGTFVTATPFRGAAAAGGEKWWQGWTNYARDF